MAAVSERDRLFLWLLRREEKVMAKDLRIRKGAGTDTAWTGKYVPPGVYTIVEVKDGKGSEDGWRRLKSGAGWIALSYCKRV